jgi:hypothetical protein
MGASRRAVRAGDVDDRQQEGEPMEWGDLGKAVVGFVLGFVSAYAGHYWKV